MPEHTISPLLQPFLLLLLRQFLTDHECLLFRLLSKLSKQLFPPYALRRQLADTQILNLPDYIRPSLARVINVDNVTGRNTIQTLIIEETHRALSPGDLPISITDLYLHWDASFYLNVGSIPHGVRKLTIDCGLQSGIVPELLPDTIEDLEIGVVALSDSERFVGELDITRIVPSNIRKLVLGCNPIYWDVLCSVKLGILPSSLTWLQLPNGFNSPILPGVLPGTLKTLHLGYTFNQPLQPGWVQDGIECLWFSGGSMDCHYSDFNQPLTSNFLPESIRVLRLGDAFNYKLVVGTLPPLLKELHISTIHPDSILPDNLLTLCLESISSRESMLCKAGNLDATFDFQVKAFEEIIIPEGVDTANLRVKINDGCIIFPSTLRYLNLKVERYGLDICLPEGLLCLILRGNYRPKDLNLPKSLKHLELDCEQEPILENQDVVDSLIYKKLTIQDQSIINCEYCAYQWKYCVHPHK